MIVSANSAAKTAAPNSNLGIVWAACGANFAFPRTNPVWHAPSSLMTWRYATAAIALTDASEKTCSSFLRAVERVLSTYVLGIYSSLRPCKDFLHASHASSLSSGRGESQSRASLESSLNRNFPSIMIGATNPSGSKRLFTVASIPLRVKGFLISVTWKVNVSLFTSQLSPRLRWMGVGSTSKLRSLNPFAWSSTGNAFITSLLLEANLCSLKFEVASISLVRVSRSMAPAAVGVDRSPSST